MRKTNTTGKPYAGKPHVRFDEGAEERLSAPRLYSTAAPAGGQVVARDELSKLVYKPCIRKTTFSYFLQCITGFLLYIEITHKHLK
jgi:hypothetical protein